MNTRKCDELLQLDEIIFRKEGRLDLTVIQQLPTYRYIYNRYLTLLSQKSINRKNKKETVTHELAEEIRDIWVFMNIPPMTRYGISKKLEKVLSHFDIHRKTAKSKRGPNSKWNKDQYLLVSNLNHGFDVKAKSADVIQQNIADYDVIPGTEEDDLHKDNCLPNPETGMCSRQIWCGSTDQEWLKKANKRRTKLQRANELALKREQKQNDDKMKLQSMKMELNQATSYDAVEDVLVEAETASSAIEDHDLFSPSKKPKRVINQEITSPKPVTRSAEKDSKETSSNMNKFPKVPVRTSYKTFNLDVLEALVVMESVYKVDARKAPHLLAYIANSVFKQEWVVLPEKDGKKEEDEKQQYFDYVLPHRSNIASKVENFALLSFLDMAESIENAKLGNQVVTYGSDDTTKAAGNKKFDMKTTHITIMDEGRKRQTFTSGFYENISHKGIHAADTIRYDIAKMSILTGNTYEDMFQMIDFFMTDRAGDANTMLDDLGLEEEKRLKCNAHILLAVDVAIDKVFRDTETLIGVSQLIRESAAHVFNAPKSSIWYLGLIAFAKLLSPSHTKESISLYTDYTKFLRDDSNSESETSSTSKTLLKNGFKGFQANRFGRIGEISSTTVEHKDLVTKFFDKMIDMHANKLVLAVHAYHGSEWFLLCCSIAKTFYDEVILPIKQMLRIDEFKKTSGPVRSWDNLKKGFMEILKKLESYEKPGIATAKEKLEMKVALQIKEAIRRQLDAMKFYREESISKEVKDLMDLAPHTNLGTESEFAHGDNDLKRAGGSTSLKTISNKHVIKRNALFKKSKWKCLTDKEKRKKWRWASGSPEAKKVKVLEAEFNKKIQSVKDLAFEEKEKVKRRIDVKLMKNLEACKAHGGPLTEKDIDKVESLHYEQLVEEVGYLKKTIAPQLRFKRKVDKKFVKFNADQLKQQIKDVIKPKNDRSCDINSLLEDALSTTAVDEQANECEPPIAPGTHGLWRGPLDEVVFGVLLDATHLQPYKEKRFGYVPDDIPQDAREWTLTESFTNDRFRYVARGNIIFVVLQ